MHSPSHPLSSAVMIVAVACLAGQIKADFTITEPVGGTNWTPGSRVTVKWTGAGAGLDPQASWPIELMAGGNANSLSNLGNVGTAKEVDGTYSFVVPSDLPPGTTYAVRMGEHYSHQFTVGPPGSGSPNPTTTAANGAPSVANRNATGLQANSTQLLVNSTNSTTNSTLKPTTTTPLPTTPPSPTPSPGTLPLNPNIGMSGAMALPLNHVSSYAMVAPLLALVYLIDA